MEAQWGVGPMFWLASMVHMDVSGSFALCILESGAYGEIGAKDLGLNGKTHLVLSGEFEFR
jgi:hypothetical protein